MSFSCQPFWLMGSINLLNFLTAFSKTTTYLKVLFPPSLIKIQSKDTEQRIHIASSHIKTIMTNTTDHGLVTTCNQHTQNKNSSPEHTLSTWCCSGDWVRALRPNWRLTRATNDGTSFFFSCTVLRGETRSWKDYLSEPFPALRGIASAGPTFRRIPLQACAFSLQQ